MTSCLAFLVLLAALALPPGAAAQTAPPDVAAPPANAAKTASGLASVVATPGSGTVHPTPADLVSVHYTVWTADGKMFDSSRTAGKPASFFLNKTMAGLSEGVQLMVTGESRRLWIPESLATRGTREPKGALLVEVELLALVSVPPDVSAAPADATKTASGLAYKVLSPGTGARHPVASSRVTVNYTGWTAADGKMFDTSVTRGQAATFGLGDVITGWSEGLQLMVVGEKARFWIPESLAYQGKSDPRGMLVFDVELVSIE